jgi:hypothetical protein
LNFKFSVSNNIKFVEANCFLNLKNLEIVDFHTNTCFNKIFDKAEVAKLILNFTENCGIKKTAAPASDKTHLIVGVVCGIILACIVAVYILYWHLRKNHPVKPTVRVLSGEIQRQPGATTPKTAWVSPITATKNERKQEKLQHNEKAEEKASTGE